LSRYYIFEIVGTKNSNVVFLTGYYFWNRKKKLQIFALPNIFFRGWPDRRITFTSILLKSQQFLLFHPSIRQQSQHFTFNSNNKHNNIHSHQSSAITTVENNITNLCVVIYMNKVYIKNTRKTQWMSRKNIVAH
jgi:hypothetical protein